EDMHCLGHLDGRSTRIPSPVVSDRLLRMLIQERLMSSAETLPVSESTKPRRSTATRSARDLQISLPISGNLSRGLLLSVSSIYERTKTAQIWLISPRCQLISAPESRSSRQAIERELRKSNWRGCTTMIQLCYAWSSIHPIFYGTMGTLVDSGAS
ncbi:hypothetical protein PMAYCL1PPCAC_24762, partial [Pristionchus mayeri]